MNLRAKPSWVVQFTLRSFGVLLPLVEIVSTIISMTMIVPVRPIPALQGEDKQRSEQDSSQNKMQLLLEKDVALVAAVQQCHKRVTSSTGREFGLRASKRKKANIETGICFTHKSWGTAGSSRTDFLYLTLDKGWRMLQTPASVPTCSVPE